MSENFSQKVDQINAQLRGFGREAVQEVKMMKDGQVIGQIRYGYKPQYVFDAVNSILLPENWRYEIVSKEIFEFQAVVEVRLFIRISDEWLCKGSQTGQMQIVRKNVGDAYKGAITDAIQKCFSLISIGSDAYKGLLKEVYLNTDCPRGEPPSPSTLPKQIQNQQPVYREPPQQQQGSPEPPPPTTSTSELPDGLPEIAGIEYQRRNGRVIAMGDAYEKRNLLKSAGFRWDRSEKNWFKDVAVH